MPLNKWLADVVQDLVRYVGSFVVGGLVMLGLVLMLQAWGVQDSSVAMFLVPLVAGSACAIVAFAVLSAVMDLP